MPTAGASMGRVPSLQAACSTRTAATAGWSAFPATSWSRSRLRGALDRPNKTRQGDSRRTLPGIAQCRSAELHRHEDPLIAVLHEKRDRVLLIVHDVAQLLHAIERRAVGREDDVAGLDACIGCRSRRVLDEQTRRNSGLRLLLRCERAHVEAEASVLGAVVARLQLAALLRGVAERHMHGERLAIAPDIER